MELGLKMVKGLLEGEVLRLPAGRRLVLGRWSPGHEIEADWPVSGVISRRHCEVWRDEAGVWVQDLLSHNGTWVNGSVIPHDQPHRLLPCDWLRLGETILRLIFRGSLEPGWLAWGGGTVRGLVRGIREAGWQGQGPVLHDALLDAGCRDADLLEHCRAGCPHGTDCTLLGLLLDGEADRRHPACR